ncbi:MAG: type IV pilus biogenesis/stability protein PilW [Rhodoferax sp.]
MVWGCGLLGLLLLSACASSGNSTAAKADRGDLVTASDEGDSRKRARLRLELATGYFSNGQVTVALDEVKQAIATDPSYFDAYSLRALIYQRLSNPALAEESFRKALTLNPKASSVQHNYGVFLCQQDRFPEALQMFSSALSDPLYGERAKTWMAQGGCEFRNGKPAAAEASYLKSYEYDPGNPITAYNLTQLLHDRGDDARAQFYIRRLNNSALANSESLWLGIKVERKLSNQEAAQQLASQLRKRFPQSKEAASLERGAYHE